ncbi:hypothetical protein ACWD4T_29270 [Streptomyces umbrinus]
MPARIAYRRLPLFGLLVEPVAHLDLVRARGRVVSLAVVLGIN